MDEWRDGVRQIQNELMRMTQLLDNLMELARADAGVEACAFEAVDINPLLAEACRRAMPLAQDKGLDFAGADSAAPMEVRGNALLLERLFAILLDNAVKYTTRGARSSSPPNGRATPRLSSSATPGSA